VADSSQHDGRESVEAGRSASGGEMGDYEILLVVLQVLPRRLWRNGRGRDSGV